MKIVSVNQDRYVVLETVPVPKAKSVDSEQLKKRHFLADTVLRKDNTLYICYKIIDAEFIEIKDNKGENVDTYM
jgi:hypothetical protein